MALARHGASCWLTVSKSMLSVASTLSECKPTMRLMATENNQWVFVLEEVAQFLKDLTLYAFV